MNGLYFWTIFTLVTLNAAFAQRRPGEGDERPPACPNMQACRDHYFHEGAHIRDNLLPQNEVETSFLNGENSRLSVTKAESRKEIGRLEMELQTQASLQSGVDATATILRNNALPAAEMALLRFESSASRFYEVVPSIVLVLRDWIRQPPALEYRIADIDLSLTGELTAEARGRLELERAILMETVGFRKQCVTAAEFDRIIMEMAQGKFDPRVSALSPETLALLRSASMIPEFVTSESEMIDVVRLSFSENVRSLKLALSSIEALQENYRVAQENIRAAMRALTVEISTAEQRINGNSEQIAALSAFRNQCERRLGHTNDYWQGCGQSERCKMIPANGNFQAYRQFEFNVHSDTVDVCRLYN